MLDRFIEADPKRVVDIIVDVSVSGAPLKQSPCIFALARAVSKMTGDPKRDTNNADPVTIGRAYALEKAPLVLRTLQHVFEFLEYCRRQRGGGPGLHRALTRAIGDDYNKAEYQFLKYRQRNGWTVRDLLRWARPKATSDEMNGLFAWAVNPQSEKARAAVAASPRLAAFEKLQAGGLSPDEIAALVKEHRLTHEQVPNDVLNQPETLKALLPEMPLTALIRNLRRLTIGGVLNDKTENREQVATVKAKLENKEAIQKARVHPLRILMADVQYRSGTDRQGRGYTPSSQALGALENALELSYKALEPMGRNVVVAVDQSGSMGGFYYGGTEALGGLKPFEAGLALATVYKRTEPACTLLTYDTKTVHHALSNNVTFNELKSKLGCPGGATDCSSPLKWLLNKQDEIDPEVVILITDNETWAGRTHVVEALTQLRKKSKHPIAFIVAAVTATASTVADPNDPDSLEIVGFDPTVPEAIAAHVKEVFRKK